MQAATRSAHPTPSPSILPGRRPALVTDGCERRSAPCFALPPSIAAARSWWRTWTSPRPARPAGRPSGGDGAASPSAGRSRGSQRERSVPCWSAWPPTMGCGSSRGSRLDIEMGAALLATTPRAVNTKTTAVTGHHAAAVVIARRGLGLGARRRPGVPGHDRRIVAGELPARPDRQCSGREGPGLPGGQPAAAAPRKTRPAERVRLGNQVVQDRSGPPRQEHLLPTPQERFVGPKR
jgi:hypothetical protein